jgi:hypothetical protein
MLEKKKTCLCGQFVKYPFVSRLLLKTLKKRRGRAYLVILIYRQNNRVNTIISDYCSKVLAKLSKNDIRGTF